VRVARNLITGSPTVIELTQVVAADRDIVWKLLTDWEDQDLWQLEASDFRVVTPQREGVGVEAEATVKIGGIRTRDRVRVTGWEPNRRLEIEHLGWVSGKGELILTPVPAGGTHVFWREELDPPLGLLGAVGLAAFKPLMTRTFKRDLRALAALARARNSGAAANDSGP
jgi:hypothetical protein